MLSDLNDANGILLPLYALSPAPEEICENVLVVYCIHPDSLCVHHFTRSPNRDQIVFFRGSLKSREFLLSEKNP